MSNYRIESSQKATVNGRKGRIIQLYDDAGHGSVFAGKYFIPASVRSNKAAIEYALDVRAESDEAEAKDLRENWA